MKFKENKMKNQIIEKISINVFILMLIILTYKLNIQICIINKLFSIPCPCCGITRSFIYLLKGEIAMSLKYNILTIPLLIFYSIYMFFYIRDIIKKENIVNTAITKYKVHIIVIGIILLIISSIKNIFNPLLY